MTGFLLGGLERVVLDLATAAQAQGTASLVIGLTHDGPLRQAFLERGVAAELVPDNGLTVGAVRHIARALSGFGADVVHAHDLGPWLNAVAARALQPSTQVVATFHGMAVPAGSQKPAAMLAAQVSGALVACGHEVRGQVESWAPRRTRLETIGNGVCVPPPATAEQRAAARARLGLPLDARVVGFLGRFMEIKGPHLLIDAFRSRFANDPRAHLVMVGSGPMEPELREKARGLGHIHFPGFLLDAPALLPAFDVYAQPSLSEGRSLAMLEAMVAGLPTVAHDLPGVREIHPDGTTAHLAPLGDTVALADALERLVRDPERSAAMGQAARRAGMRYSFEHTFAAYGALYRDVAKARA